MNSALGPVLPVAVGVVNNPSGQILVAQRPAGDVYAGYWEFPGGKVERDETDRQALLRELREELGIEVRGAEPLIRITYAYPERWVALRVFRVTQYLGVPGAREGQLLRWVAPPQLGDLSFLPANRNILRAIQLPNRYAILDVGPDALGTWKQRLERQLQLGLRLIQLRAKALSPQTCYAVARAVAAVCASAGVELVLNGDPAVAEALGIGLHLPSAVLRQLSCRPRVAPGRWLSVSCHDLYELQLAQLVDADLALLGPVLPTVSHPGAPPLGWQRFAELAELVSFPVYALGGLTVADQTAAQRAGAQGIAGISTFLPHSR